jgi:L-alanine-DL-glutamate epimerase-like enolase superfamily enzyme
LPAPFHCRRSHLLGAAGCCVKDFIENGKAEVIQIDQGRIGGLTSTYQVRQLCAKHGRVFVNHSFKSHLSIAAALHAMATDENSEVMEFPQGETELSAGLVLNPLLRDAEGLVHAPRTPGLGVEINLELVKKLAVPLTIETGVSHAINDDPNNGSSRLYSADNVLAKL